MTVLRLERRANGRIEAALASVDEVVLARTSRGAFADITAAEADMFIRELAFAGVQALPSEDRLEPGPDVHPAVGRHLVPLTGAAVSLDLVRVRRLSLGESTAQALTRRWGGFWPPSRAARERCRALLRGTEVAFLWTRLAWGTRAALRTPAARAALRPIVFDTAAIAGGPAGRVYASEGALERWLF